MAKPHTLNEPSSLIAGGFLASRTFLNSRCILRARLIRRMVRSAYVRATTGGEDASTRNSPPSADNTLQSSNESAKNSVKHSNLCHRMNSNQPCSVSSISNCDPHHTRAAHHATTRRESPIFETLRPQSLHCMRGMTEFLLNDRSFRSRCLNNQNAAMI